MPDTNSAEAMNTQGDRAAARVSLYIRTAKLLCDGVGYVCVIRDVSASGVSLRMFHELPVGKQMALQLQTGESHAVEMVWNRDNQAGFRFNDGIDVEKFVAEKGDQPKRPLRFSLDLPVLVDWHDGSASARLSNLSQQGAAILCETKLAIDQPVRIGRLGRRAIDGPRLPDLTGKVRWRHDDLYGVVLENTFRLEDFALLIRQLHRSSRPAAAHSEAEPRLAQRA